MDDAEALTPEAARAMLAGEQPPDAAQVQRILRMLLRANDELLGKLRQLKSEVSRNARK
jgi:hypothetical protein